MGWRGKFLGGFLGGLPGTFIGDLLENACREDDTTGKDKDEPALLNDQRERLQRWQKTGATGNRRS